HPGAERGPAAADPERGPAALAGRHRDDRARLVRHRLPAEEAAGGALPRRQPPRCRRLRADALAADAAAAAAQAPGEARGTTLSTTPFAVGAADVRPARCGELRDVVRRERVARHQDARTCGWVPGASTTSRHAA